MASERFKMPAVRRFGKHLGVTLILMLLVSVFQPAPPSTPQVGGVCDPSGPLAVSPSGQLLVCRSNPGWRQVP